VGIPIIFLTASKQPGLREKAMRLGAAAFFEKPYEAAELLAAIEAALSGSGIGSL
jgi:FixJ family two-component response regulator